MFQTRARYVTILQFSFEARTEISVKIETYLNPMIYILSKNMILNWKFIGDEKSVAGMKRTE